MMKSIKRFALFSALAITLAAGSCYDDAKVVEQNLIKAADNFEVYRKISFNNDYTNEYILVVEGLCSMDVNDAKTAFNVICKVGPNEYLRHTQVLSTFTSATVEQLKTSNVSAYHYRMTYKPQAILPDIDFRGSLEELTTNTAK